jgi:hypothetical protein
VFTRVNFNFFQKMKVNADSQSSFFICFIFSIQVDSIVHVVSLETCPKHILNSFRSCFILFTRIMEEPLMIC